MSHDPADAPEWLPLGPHFYRVDFDTVFMRTIGNTTLENTIFYTDLCKQRIAEHGYALGIIDLTAAGSSSPEARRYQAKAFKEFPAGCNEIAIYGMSRLVSTFVQLSVRATTLMSGREVGVVFVSDEAAALRWRDERRPVLKSRFGRGGNR